MTDTTCWHCSNPAPPDTFVARTPEGSRPACCPGCAAAIETVYGLGLDDYYRVRESAAPVPDDHRMALNLALFSVPELVNPHLKNTPEGQRIRVQLSGLTCAACSWLIEKALREQPGVNSASVNLAGMTLSIDYLGPAQIEDTARRVMRLGYGISLPNSPHEQQARKQEQRRLVGRLALAGLGAMQAMMYSTALYIGVFDGSDAIYENVFRIASLVVATPVVFYAGWPFFQGAIRGLRGATLTMDVPIALALLLAWAGSIAVMVMGGRHVYFDSAAMFVFFLLASRWLEQRQRQAIHGAWHQLEETLPVAVRRHDDSLENPWISTRQIVAGMPLMLHQGETVPCDGIIQQGQGAFDEAALTGESVPRSLCSGATVHAGSRLVEGNVVLQALGPPSSSLVAKIGEQVERAQQERITVVRDWQRIAPLFTLAVLCLAGTTLAWHWSAGPAQAFEHTLAVLVITCPCALALAVPLTLSATLGTALRQGVLIASPRQFLSLTRLKGVMLDKTGTLTAGRFQISQLERYRDDFNDEQLLAIAAALEWQNPHPLAGPFQQCPRDPDVTAIQADHHGVNGHRHGLPWRITGLPDKAKDGATCLGLYQAERLSLCLWLEDSVRPEATTVLNALSIQGLVVRMATGDNPDAAAHVASRLPIYEWRAQQTPQEKQQWVQALERQDPQMMVGDGINDAGAMLAATASVATGNATSLAQRAAGIFLLDDSLAALPRLAPLAAACQQLVRQNLGWALLYNLLAVPFAVAGLIPPWAAAIGMSASSLLVTLNASRITRWKL
ncbi:cation-transporting P-type ATPase [Alcanivorax sp. MD8A]|uniref:heavy metal translocating P-type ATPase n=1 Tax=Alcanivorax sp. MD8A TaxID=1177157 RepID=UPI000C9B92AE|nr:heavy metal translocating P-type ATPase [Alcanivorax sp. MD8A]PNE02106.1 cation-transporting P-type ATPase [Alcanivorax sp. MD8A]